MNKDTVKGTLNDAAGRAKRQIGEWTNDPDKEVEGAAQQIKGKAQKVVGQVKDAIHETNANKTATKQEPDSVEEEKEEERHRTTH